MSDSPIILNRRNILAISAIAGGISITAPLRAQINIGKVLDAGKDVANPFGAILTTQLMFEHLNLNEEAQLIDSAVRKAIRENQTTHDLGGKLGTRGVGDYISKAIREGK